MFSKAMISLMSLSFGLVVSGSAWADSHPNGHDLVQDVHKEGTRIEFEEDQDEVYEAVREGYIRPFSEMYAAVESDLHGRIIKVELEEDDDIWVYELKINYKNNIIKVEYNAETLEMLMIKGRNFKDAIKTDSE
ncbi:membrane protein [Vibrio fortis]|uniref:Membrane protein n=1 Tax=Vibrio fortis TaxID=212667 RepID=A0A066UQ08_9VIBR|nr:membrane protein [Vibrio fortis]KDN27982.1 membrane protein [Vibrio fortis]